MKTPIGRLAPSPTGALHLGNIRTFMIAWLQMRVQGGRILMRIEDLDHPKHKQGSEVQMLDELRWLGFDWDDEIVIQSQRLPYYQAALEKLCGAGRAYPCICSRKEVETAMSAPHSGEVLYYAGTCRERFTSYAQAQTQVPLGRLPAWRFRLDPCDLGCFVDGFSGECLYTAAETSGDFVFARDPHGVGYTLAVVVDDAEMGVTDIVRGDDLLPATPAQILLYRALALSEPIFYHVPLVVGSDGRRLAKRHGDTRIETYRQNGIKPEQIIGALARSCGWTQAPTATLRDLIHHFTFDTIPHEAFIWSDTYL